MEERRGSVQSILAVSTVVSILVGAASLLSFIQSSERRTTVMEVKIEGLQKGIERMENTIRESEGVKRGGKI